jgi:hypothetical protein
MKMSVDPNGNPIDTTITGVDGGQGNPPVETPPANPNDGNPPPQGAGEGNPPAGEPTGKEAKPPSILGGEEKPPQEPGGEEVKFDFADLAKELDMTIDEAQNAEFVEVLKQVGVADNEKANLLAKYGLQYAAQQIEEVRIAKINGMYKETTDFYGGEDSEKYKEAVGQAGQALQVLEKHIPGLRQALAHSEVDCSLPLVQLFEKLAPMLGEGGNLMNGGSGADASTNMYPNTDFKKY